MNQKEAGQLLNKYLQGKASPQQETIVQSWLMHQTTNLDKKADEPTSPIPPEMWTNVYQSIHQKKKPQWLPMAVAASIAIISLGLGILIYQNQQTTNQTTAMLANRIRAGKIGATLMLGNGRKINLSDAATGELAKESGTCVSKTANGQVVYELTSPAQNNNRPGQLTANTKQAYNTLATAKGQTYQLRLPDGSLVWLNAASSLTYTANLIERGKRRVKLDGEGYFEVAKDKTHPFVVESKNQSVEVLGTHFNIKAYADENIIRTTLLEGSVKVAQYDKSAQLIPGQQAVNTGAKLKVISTDTDLAIAWKDNKFIFDSQHIEDIMRMIARWYNVEVIYADDIPKETFWGSISRFDNVSKVLEKLESTEKVHFKIEGKKIYVLP